MTKYLYLNEVGIIMREKKINVLKVLAIVVYILLAGMIVVAATV